MRQKEEPEWDYRLNTVDNTVTKLDAGKDYSLYGIPMQEISDEFAIEGNALRYKGNVILSGLEGELLENPLVFAWGYSTETATLLSVRLLYHAEVPAPYTPRVEYAFMEDKTGVHRVETWNENDYAMRFSETDSAYYIGSLGRGIAGTRFGVNMSTIVKKEKTTGKETVLNPLYDKNASLEMIGVYDSKLYVRACWFGTDEDAQRPDYYYKRVNPARDGFYTIDKNNHFERVGEYLDGTPFLTKDGKLYVSAEFGLNVVDVINQQRVTVK